MFSKIIFALAMVCVVNASLLTASEDDPEIEMASIAKRCDLQSCEKLCHRLNFPGGACVNGRCKCDNFLNAEEDTETDVTANQNTCKVTACHWVCRILHKTSGSCVDGRCKCEKSRNAEEEKPTDLEDLGSLIEDAADEYSELDTSVCKLRKCNRTCARRGYESATCIKGRCKCFNITKTSLPVSELSEAPTERGCSSLVCNKLCRRLKFRSGACVNGHCKCKLFSVAEEEPTVPAPSACNTVNCNQMCRRHKYAGGWCQFGQCRCY